MELPFGPTVSKMREFLKSSKCKECTQDDFIDLAKDAMNQSVKLRSVNFLLKLLKSDQIKMKGKLKVEKMKVKVILEINWWKSKELVRIESLGLESKIILTWKSNETGKRRSGLKISHFEIVFNNKFIISIRYCNEARRVCRVLGPVTFEMESIYDILRRDMIGIFATDGIIIIAHIKLLKRDDNEIKIGTPMASMLETINKKTANQISAAADWLIHADTIHIPINSRDLFFGDSNLKMIMEKHVQFTRNPWATYYHASTTANLCQMISTVSLNSNIEKVMIMTGSDDLVSPSTNANKFEYELEWIIIKLLSKVEVDKILIIDVVRNDNLPEKSRIFESIVRRLCRRYKVLYMESPSQYRHINQDGYLTTDGAYALIEELKRLGCRSIEPKRNQPIIRVARPYNNDN